MVEAAQTDLFAWKPDAKVLQRFEAFNAVNPHVWELFKRFTFERIAARFRHYSADAILHRVRWETEVADDPAGHAQARGEPGTAEPLKINNNWSALYARRWAHEFPEHRTFFRARKSMFDGAFK